MNVLLRYTKTLAFVFSALLLFTVFSVLSHAQQPKEGLNLTVSPTFFDLSNTPGNKIDGKFRIRNNTSQPLTLLLHVDKLTSTSDGRIVPVKAQSADTYLSW